jgi:hypothetical protein
MKKVLYIISILSLALLASCQKDPIGSTATVALAGEWVVTIDAVDASGNIIYEDPYGAGWDTRVWTYNTSDDVANKLYLDDIENDGDYCFWEYKVLLDCDVNAMTFAGEATDLCNDIHVSVTGGKITVNGTKTPSGTPADMIEYYIVFEDDDYAGSLYDRLYIHGYRYTGLDSDGI